MTQAFRSWRKRHRYTATVRALQALSASDLNALGITPSQIPHLALEVSSI